MKTWTDYEEKTAVAMWKEGKSGLEIGRVIGKTREAVLGKINRMGHNRCRAQEMDAVLKRIQKPKKNKPMKLPKDEGGEGVSILQLTEQTCRFLIGKNVYCGKLSHGSYCPAHNVVCYQKDNRALKFRMVDKVYGTDDKLEELESVK